MPPNRGGWHPGNHGRWRSSCRQAGPDHDDDDDDGEDVDDDGDNHGDDVDADADVDVDGDQDGCLKEGLPASRS